MLRVVFDTVVFVRSLINPHGRWGRLIFDRTERYRLYLSPPIIQEILEVLDRPAIKRKYRTITGGEMTRILDIIAQADVVEPGEIPPISRDPDDDKFLAAARLARAAYLVSEDDDLLALGEYQGTRIVNVTTFLRVLEGQAERGKDR